MNLKNYTTEVQASKSIENIEKLLVDFGALNIMKSYTAGSCTSISFIVEMNGMKLPFRLPARVDRILAWLRKKRRSSSLKVLQVQAEKIAWRQMHEWVHLQLTFIEMDQADKLELLFPFLYDVVKNQTYYDQLKQGGFKALLPSSTTQ